MSIEQNYDIEFVARLALREKQIQQNYRPIIGVHKWFARRPGSLFRALTLSEFGDAPVQDLYFESNDFRGKKVADPFMGGGTPLIEANRVGCDVQGFDINTMASWIVREEIEHLELEAYHRAADTLLEALKEDVGSLYRTDCPIYGDADVPVKYFIWVKEVDCTECGAAVPLFPGYLLARDVRHPDNVVVCHECYELNEVEDLDKPGKCAFCRTRLVIDGPAKRGRCRCPSCGHTNTYPRPTQGPLRHRLIGIEYFNPARKQAHKGRFFKAPDAKDLSRCGEAVERWADTVPRFVPDQPILSGDETDRLHRWGYQRYRELFNPRQLLGLEASARLIADLEDGRVRHALATNFSDLLRYQNMLCRYDTMALKSLDIFSVHGFPVGLVQVESNLLGIVNGGGVNVGSGGWSNIIEKYSRAKRYCDAPFEIAYEGGKKVQRPIKGEWIGERLNGHRHRSVSIRCASSADVELEANTLDAVFTDPPYFGNVQYGELMDFCYVWLRQVLGKEAEGFERVSSRDYLELTVNQTAKRDIDNFTEGLAAVYRRMARALRPGAPLVFTYHHNKAFAYHSVAVAILDAGLTCSASLPCPAEMGGSIHIHGTGSSIVDTVFVCRSTGATARDSLCRSADELKGIVAKELIALRAAGMKPRPGDVRCMLFGHVARMAIWNLRCSWDASKATPEKIEAVAQEFETFGDLHALIEPCLDARAVDQRPGRLFEAVEIDERKRNAVAF